MFHLPCYPGENEEELSASWNDILENDYDIVHLGTALWDGFILEDLTYGKSRIITHSHALAFVKWTSDEFF